MIFLPKTTGHWLLYVILETQEENGECNRHGLYGNYSVLGFDTTGTIIEKIGEINLLEIQ